MENQMNKCGLSRRMRKLGVEESIIASVLRLGKTSKVRIPRIVKNKIAERLADEGRCVVVLKNGRFSVFSVEGHRNRSLRSLKNLKRPHEIRATKKAKKAITAAAENPLHKLEPAGV